MSVQQFSGNRDRHQHGRVLAATVRWRAFVVLSVALSTAGCGARSELDTGGRSYETPRATGEGGQAEPSGGGTLPRACPPCAPARACSTPWACLEADGCTYGWCGADGLETDGELCDTGYKTWGWCLTTATADLCAYSLPGPEGPVSRTCVWPREGGSACNPRSTAASDQICGRVRCGSGCECLCENICWCGG